MKLDKWLSCLVGAVLAFVLGFGGTACMATAFDLGTDLGSLALWCGICAGVFSVCITLKLSWLPLGALALLAGFFWREGSLALSMEALLNHISRFYHNAYGLGVAAWSGQTLESVDRTQALCAIAAVVSPVIAWTVCRQKRAIWAVLISLLPLCACLVVTDTVPDIRCLGLLLFGLTLLILTQTTRRRDARQGNLLTALTAVPVALALWVLFLAVPQSTYDKDTQADRVLQQLQSLLSQPTFQGESTMSAQEDLSSMGMVYNPHLPVMDVTAERSGTIYLRKQVFGSYTGTGWQAGSHASFPEAARMDHFENAGVVTVTTRFKNDFYYVPYYSADIPLSSNGIMEMAEAGTTSYGMQTYLPLDNSPWQQIMSFSEAACGELPSQTLSWATPVVRSLVEDSDSTYSAARKIADYVRASARYSKNTARMPDGKSDFVRWFLEDSDTGYCVHFASATAVLLQAAGIPARYATGYMVTAQAGQQTTVYMDDAHAWVEYYVPDAGWILLESTPSDGLPDESQSTEPALTTQPEDTTTAAQEETPPAADPSPESTRPAAPSEPGEKADLGWLVNILIWAAWILGAVLLVLGQWRLRLWLRNRKMTRGTANQRAIACWREAVFFARLLREKPDGSLFALAQKAKFSQYTLESAELTQFETYLRRCRVSLKQKPFLQGLLYRLVFAAY